MTDQPFAPPPGAGSYDRDPVTGKLTLAEEATREHPEGNRAREADGTPIDVEPVSPPPIPAAAPAAIPQPPAGTAPAPVDHPPLQRPVIAPDSAPAAGEIH